MITVGTLAMGALTLVSAIARRIAGPYGSRRLAAEAVRGRLGADPGAQRALEELREEVEQLRGELDVVQGRLSEVDELQNRVDFAERMLAQSQGRGALGAPKDG